VASVVNLNKFKKQKAKIERVKRAEVNRRLHGRTKGERACEELNKRLLDAKLNGLHLEREETKTSEE
jgi:hypothetical protein